MSNYKKINISASATAAIVGAATKVRVRVKDGVTQFRFTERVSLVNLPDDERVYDLGTKGNARVIGLKADFAHSLETGTKFGLVYSKYGWYSAVPVSAEVPQAGSVSA